MLLGLILGIINILKCDKKVEVFWVVVKNFFKNVNMVIVLVILGGCCCLINIIYFLLFFLFSVKLVIFCFFIDWFKVIGWIVNCFVVFFIYDV